MGAKPIEGYFLIREEKMNRHPFAQFVGHPAPRSPAFFPRGRAHARRTHGHARPRTSGAAGSLFLTELKEQLATEDK